MTPVPYQQPCVIAIRPEFFLSVDGKTIPASKVVNVDTLPTMSFHSDKVRISVNACGDSCRANHANNVKSAFANLKTILKPNVSVDLTPRQKGFKSANGSLFITNHGYLCSTERVKLVEQLTSPAQLIALFDTVVANTGTMLGMGRRISAYAKIADGISYQTMSNWYLRSYPLTGLTLGLMRFCVLAAMSGQADEILGAVKPKRIQRAIESADIELATSNWQSLEPVLMSGMVDFPNHPLCAVQLPTFHHFLKRGLNHWFKTPIRDHWATLPEAHYCGWETFLVKTVAPDMS